MEPHGVPLRLAHAIPVQAEPRHGEGISGGANGGGQGTPRGKSSLRSRSSGSSARSRLRWLQGRPRGGGAETWRDRADLGVAPPLSARFGCTPPSGQRRSLGRSTLVTDPGGAGGRTHARRSGLPMRRLRGCAADWKPALRARATRGSVPIAHAIGASDAASAGVRRGLETRATSPRHARLSPHRSRDWGFRSAMQGRPYGSVTA